MPIQTFGLEREFFLVKRLTPEITEPAMVPPTMPKDACGYLAEARSEPHADPATAVCLLRAAELKLAKQASDAGLLLDLQDTVELPKEFLRVALRTHGKGPAYSFFMNGKTYKHSMPRAGLHVHFGNVRTDEYVNRDIVARRQVFCQLNIPRIIFLMDKYFKEEIKAAKRVAGEYEMKHHGFEYRSLPAASTSMDKLMNVLDIIRKEGL